jgi:hypothetical protein
MQHRNAPVSCPAHSKIRACDRLLHVAVGDPANAAAPRSHPGAGQQLCFERKSVHQVESGCAVWRLRGGGCLRRCGRIASCLPTS